MLARRKKQDFGFWDKHFIYFNNNNNKRGQGHKSGLSYLQSHSIQVTNSLMNLFRKPFYYSIFSPLFYLVFNIGRL